MKKIGMKIWNYFWNEFFPYECKVHKSKCSLPLVTNLGGYKQFGKNAHFWLIDWFFFWRHPLVCCLYQECTVLDPVPGLHHHPSTPSFYTSAISLPSHSIVTIIYSFKLYLLLPITAARVDINMCRMKVYEHLCYLFNNDCKKNSYIPCDH